MSTILGKNWMTTIGGLLAGIPTLIVSSGFVLPPKWTKILNIVGGLGLLLIGLAAKDFTTHSTETQVIKSTVEAEQAASVAGK